MSETTETTEEATGAEDQTETETAPEEVTEDSSLIAALEAQGIEVLYKADGTPVINMPKPADPEPAKAVKSARKAPVKRPATTQQSPISKSAEVKLGPTDGKLSAEDAYKMSLEIGKLEASDRASLLNNTKILI